MLRIRPHKLGIIGNGSQAEAHVEALMCVTEIESISVAGRSEEKVRAFVSKLRGKLGSDVKVRVLRPFTVLACAVHPSL